MSVATLVRVVFEDPQTGELMLALERKATLSEKEGGRSVDVKAQPFGGAIRVHDLRVLRDAVGNFRFDSEISRSEQDFRIFVRPSAWKLVRQFCLKHFSQPNSSVLESDPTRELAEEFTDTLRVDLKADQYAYRPLRIVVENIPSPTENPCSLDSLTARIYRIFEAYILNPSLIRAMLSNSESYSNLDLEKLAFEDDRNGGPGWANAVLALSLNKVSAFYLSTSPQARNRPVLYLGHRLDETVAAILENISIPKYQNISP